MMALIPDFGVHYETMDTVTRRLFCVVFVMNF